MRQIEKLNKNLNLRDKEQCAPFTWDVQVLREGWVQSTITDVDEETTLLGQKGQEIMEFKDYHVPMQVYCISDYNNPDAIDSGNHLFICPRGEEPRLDNLMPFDKSNWNIWSINAKANTHYRRDGFETTTRIDILRNGKVFDTVFSDDMGRGLILAQSMIFDLNDAPVPWQYTDIDYIDQIIGRKCTWKGRPCTITSYIEGQNAVMLDIKDEQWDEEIKDHLFSSAFDWYHFDEYEYEENDYIDDED